MFLKNTLLISIKSEFYLVINIVLLIPLPTLFFNEINCDQRLFIDHILISGKNSVCKGNEREDIIITITDTYQDLMITGLSTYHAFTLDFLEIVSE